MQIGGGPLQESMLYWFKVSGCYVKLKEEPLASTMSASSQAPVAVEPPGCSLAAEQILVHWAIGVSMAARARIGLARLRR